MAIAFRAVGAKATDGVTPFTQTVAFPAGLVANDIVILFASTDNDAAGTITIDTAGSISTWTAITGTPVTVAAGAKLYAWWGRWSSGTTGPTLTSTANNFFGITSAYSGCITDGTVINTEAVGSETTSDTSYSFATGMTTTVNNCMIVMICTSGADSNTGQYDTGIANANLSAVTLRYEEQTNAGAGAGGFCADGLLAVDGAVGTWSATMLNATAKAYVAIALKPTDAIVDQTVLGKGRLQKTVDQTTTGKARIQTTVDKTTTGKARIQTTVDQLTTGKGRIQTTVDQTILGRARLQKTVDQTTTGKANIVTGGTVDQTILGKARIQTTVDQTILGKARLQKTVDQTILGRARIQQIVDQTTTGKARIQTTVDQTTTGKARLQKTVDTTTTGRARIQKTVDQTITGKANIVIQVDQTILGRARLQKTIDATITGKANITGGVGGGVINWLGTDLGFFP